MVVLVVLLSLVRPSTPSPSSSSSSLSSSFDVLSLPPQSSCVSCASFAYLPLWEQLLHHYFPPKNFSDRCWQPDSSILSVPCTSACFTLVERISHLDPYGDTQRGVLRGCVERLLLFGLDEDIRERFDSLKSKTTFCRETDRKIFRLYPLSDEEDSVLMCACSGDQCNNEDMSRTMTSPAHTLLLSFIPLVLLLR